MLNQEVLTSNLDTKNNLALQGYFEGSEPGTMFESAYIPKYVNLMYNKSYEKKFGYI